MQHIVENAFDFDDSKAQKAAENAVENELDKIINSIIMDRLAPKKKEAWSDRVVRDWERFDNMIRGAVADWMETYKDTIIERAADKVADHVKRTKAWREKYTEILRSPTQ